MSLVLKKWYVSKTANSDGNYVHIAGRKSGLVAWFLALVGVDPTTEIEIKDNLISYTTGSFAGKKLHLIPLKSVCSANYGYAKPWVEALLLCLIFISFFGLGLIFGFLYYRYNTELSLGFIEVSGIERSFSFKGSVIESKTINENNASEVAEIIRQLITKST